MWLVDKAAVTTIKWLDCVQADVDLSITSSCESSAFIFNPTLEERTADTDKPGSQFVLFVKILNPIMDVSKTQTNKSSVLPSVIEEVSHTCSGVRNWKTIHIKLSLLRKISRFVPQVLLLMNQRSDQWMISVPHIWKHLDHGGGQDAVQALGMTAFPFGTCYKHNITSL